MHLLFLKKSFKVSKFQWYNFSRKNQKLANLHWRILQTIYFHSFDVLMLILYIRLFWRWIYDDTGTLITLTIAEFRRMLLSVKMSFSFQLLSVNHSEKLNWSSNSDKFSLHCTLPQHATFFSIWKLPFLHLT